MFLDLLTLGLWSKLGRLVHYGMDAVLISVCLAGIKRSTGLTPAIKVDPENKQISTWMTKYLDVGEFVMDQSIAIAGASGYFKRER